MITRVPPCETGRQKTQCPNDISHHIPSLNGRRMQLGGVGVVSGFGLEWGPRLPQVLASAPVLCAPWAFQTLVWLPGPGKWKPAHGSLWRMEKKLHIHFLL